MTIGEVTPRPGLSALLPAYAEPAGAHPGGTWRERLITEAAELTRSGGWASVTMAKLADRVGVSRQTVYNELGSKPQLAQALVMHELEVFLRVVDEAFADNPDDLVAAIRAAACQVLRMARTNPLLHAVLSASHGAESELLPLLTTRSEPLVAAAVAMIARHLEDYHVSLPAERVGAVVDMVVRLVLSHVTLPSASPEETADGIAWIAARVLGG